MPQHKPPTTNERTFLLGLVTNEATRGGYRANGEWTPQDLIEKQPSWFGSRSVQGLHQTAASLVRKGLIWKGRNDDGHVCYEIKPAGIDALK